jgi:hypothetical protein
MADVIEFPRLTRYGPLDAGERRRLVRLFAGNSIKDMRKLWDASDRRRYGDIHSYMNMLGDGLYCAV